MKDAIDEVVEGGERYPCHEAPWTTRGIQIGACGHHTCLKNLCITVYGSRVCDGHRSTLDATKSVSPRATEDSSAVFGKRTT